MTAPVLDLPLPAKAIKYPTVPYINEDVLIKSVLRFLQDNPSGVRNCEVSRSLGFTRRLDPRNWLSYGVLSHLIEQGLVRKDEARSLYFLTTDGSTHLSCA